MFVFTFRFRLELSSILVRSLLKDGFECDLDLNWCVNSAQFAFVSV